MVVSVLAGLPVAIQGQQPGSSSQIFDERIMPIFRSSDPSSCVQCHLSSVDLKNYILPSSEKTFVSLRDQGLIDLDDPKSSKILKLIEMGDKDKDDYSRRIHEDMRNAEYEAFTAWVVASCQDETLRNLPVSDKGQQARPAVPDEVIRHARKSRVVNSFARNVWSQRMRCFPCHTPHEIGPKQAGAKKKFDQWFSEYGDRMSIFKETPEATLRYLVDQSKEPADGQLPLLNLEDVKKSLLVLKPMSKIPPREGDKRIPTYSEPVYHMGGLKIHKDDHSYKAFVNWIEDYARVTNARYRSVEDLPADNWFPTQRILRMKNVPESWEVGSTVQMFVHGRSGDGDMWNETPLAFTQGTVTPRHIANGALILLAPTDAKEFQSWRSRKKGRLPPGDYLIRIFVDREGQLVDAPSSFLPPSNLAGQIELNAAKWRVGFPKAEWISGEDLVK